MKFKSKQINNMSQFSSSQGETIKSTKKQCISKITVSLENQEFTLMIYNNSTIKKLALQLLLMLYDELLECQFNEDFKIIHQQLCNLLIVEINKVSKNQKNQSYKSILTRMIEDYQHQKLKQQQKMTNKYFIKNYIKTLQDTEYLSQPSESKSFESKKNSSQNFKLYEKAKKSLQKKQKLQRENAEQKSKVQISYCTFHPNISKSQKKFKSKQKSNIYERLYSDADEIKTKIFLKKKQIQNQEEKNVSSLKFIPKINQCSKQIVEFKKRQNYNEKFLFDNLEKSQVSFQASQNSSQKYLKSNESKQVFDKLYDSNFYDNRLNKTLQKVNIDKQNECSFHPQLSQGTKKLTLNYPKLQQRMKIYQMKKSESHQGFSPCSSSSKQKSLKSFTYKFELSKLSNKEASHKNEKKGIKRMLERIKTQPLQQVQICSNTMNKRPKKQGTDKYHSQIFELDSRSDFINDSFQVTPKKLNLETTNKQKAFFKNKQEFAPKQKSAYSTSRLQNVYITEPSQQNPTKEQIFDKIFQHLSKGKDSINSNSILLSRTIPAKLKIAFEPLTSQLAEMNTQLDSEEFVWSLENLYQQLDVENKALLLSWGLRLIKNVASHVLNHKNHQVIKTEDSIFQLID